MRKKIILLGTVLFCVANLAAQDFDENRPRTVRAERADDRRSCNEFAFGAGCMGFSLGPSLGAINGNFAGGAYGILSYFIIDRLAAEARGGAVFSSSTNAYHVGPALTYYIGPFSGYLFNVSYSVSRDFFRGTISADGWSYGPWAGIMTNLIGRVYWGVAVGYTTYAIEGYRQSEWQWSPVVFIPF